MNKKIEEVKQRLKLDIKSPLACGDVTVVIVDDLEAVLNYIDNSISKEVIKEKIEEVRKMKFEDERLNGATIDFAACKFEEILEGK